MYLIIFAPRKTMKRRKNKRLKTRGYLQHVHLANDGCPEYTESPFNSTGKRPASETAGKARQLADDNTERANTFTRHFANAKRNAPSGHRRSSLAIPGDA